MNPDNSNLQGNRKRFELSRVKLVRKLPGGESKKVRVSGRFELLGVRVIGIQLYFRKHYFMSRLAVNGLPVRLGVKTKILYALASQATAASVYGLVASMLLETTRCRQVFPARELFFDRENKSCFSAN